MTQILQFWSGDHWLVLLIQKWNRYFHSKQKRSVHVISRAWVRNVHSCVLKDWQKGWSSTHWYWIILKYGRLENLFCRSFCEHKSRKNGTVIIENLASFRHVHRSIGKKKDVPYDWYVVVIWTLYVSKYVIRTKIIFVLRILSTSSYPWRRQITSITDLCQRHI